jgi:hypothetical protein
MSKTLKEPHGRRKNRTSEEAARLGISVDKLINLAKTGIIPATCLGPRSWIFDPEEVDQVLVSSRPK